MLEFFLNVQHCSAVKIYLNPLYRDEDVFANTLYSFYKNNTVKLNEIYIKENYYDIYLLFKISNYINFNFFNSIKNNDYILLMYIYIYMLFKYIYYCCNSNLKFCFYMINFLIIYLIYIYIKNILIFMLIYSTLYNIYFFVMIFFFNKTIIIRSYNLNYLNYDYINFNDIYVNINFKYKFKNKYIINIIVFLYLIGQLLTFYINILNRIIIISIYLRNNEKCQIDGNLILGRYPFYILFVFILKISFINLKFIIKSIFFSKKYNFTYILLYFINNYRIYFFYDKTIILNKKEILII